LSDLGDHHSLPQEALEDEEEEQKVEEKKKEDVNVGPSQDLRELMLKQKATGAWNLSDVANLLKGLNEDKIKNALPKAAGTSDAALALWVTAVVACFMQIKLKNQQNNWLQVVNKAKRFIAKQKKSVNGEIDWLAEAQKFVEAN